MMKPYSPPQTVIDAALDHARSEAPRECCGVVLGGTYHPMVNKALDDNLFQMDGQAYRALDASGAVEAIVHSHVYLQPIASDADRASCEATGKPWVIVSWPLGTYAVIEPSGFRAPLLGREWAWGVHDCFGLVRDGLAEYAGIHIPNFDRDWKFWTDARNDLIERQFEDAGFARLAPGSKPQQCDVLGMRVHGKVVNHLALFLEPDRILHQMSGRQSTVDVYGGTYQQLTELHLRHRQLMADASLAHGVPA